MTWLVFGVSCLLVLAGAVSIISGAPIIQLERGWAEVISGTVALSSGGIVFALSVMLVRLESLRDTLAARASVTATGTEVLTGRDLAVSSTPVGRASEPAAPADSAMVPPAPPIPETALPPVERAPNGAEHGLWKRIRRPADPQDGDRLEDQGFPDRIVPDTAPTPLEPAVDAPVIVPPHPAPVEQAAGDDGPAKSGDTGQIGWLERSLLKGRGDRTRPADPPGPLAETEPTAPFFADLAPGKRQRVEPSLGMAPDLGAMSESEPASFARHPAAEPDPTPDVAAERAEGVEVIGRYQAGSSSYVMYSDGTIEVETEDGQIHRFGSMDELKTYIGSQDTASG